MTIHRYEVTDAEQAIIEPMLPKHHMGRPQKDLRAHFNGILWIARSGARWEDLPARYGPHQTVYSCFCRWRDDGTLERIFHIGRTRGRKNTKIHALVNREGIPVCLSLSAGNRSDCDEAIPLLQQFGKIKGSNILADRAYGAAKIRLYLTEQGARYTIPPTKNLLHPWKYDRQTYKRRNVIERCFCRLKDFRRISTRYDKRADSFQAFLFLAASAVIFSILHI